ncbi:DUF6153 family protein [Nonomuraea basaltis]|uniref:DUF6153 family protein n=1 Tax=Nonomuraea basaltis TaxID=2495887 RepID=UPI00110C6AD4|nr:DUF6153 family protein [Nonomuraea basaltis]TMR97152.1 hypothetical protein EJK15_19285 [Nonomuraea basaltis]
MRPPAQRLLRPFLLALLVLGVLGMHTLGHLSSGHGAAAHGDGARPQSSSMPHAEPLMTAPADGVVIGSVVSFRFDPGTMCLAVLTSAFILLLAAAWAAALCWPTRAAVRACWAGGVARSPPRRVAPSLVRLSVMRI